MHQSPSTPAAIGAKVAHEVRALLINFVYLALFFSVVRLYTQLILAEYHVDYFRYGLTLVKALVLSKIILTAEMLRLGERFNNSPLALTTLYKTAIFTLFALVIEVAEHFLAGSLWDRRSLVDLYHEIVDVGWPHIAGMMLVVFVAFIPFFSFRETERVLGRGTIRNLFLLGHADTLD